MAWTPAIMRKTVAIIGGGIAGCEAARVLALRGHKPVIFEKHNRLGGNLHPASAPDFKEDERDLIQWYAKQLEDLNVEIHLNTAVAADAIPESFDHYIVATGSVPKVFNLGSGIPVYTAAQILEAEVASQAPYVIIGGGLVGCETAMMLANRGDAVSIVEGLPVLLGQNGPICYANSQMLIDLIHFNKIPVYTDRKAVSVVPEGLVVSHHGEEALIEAKTVILSVGYASNSDLYGTLDKMGKDVSLIGDAKSVANIMYAIWDAYEIAIGI
jgi:2-enoate reductase